ncbi:uncharacterized protein E0L32_009488 [Thyridium curvatum]|uniref:Aminoacyl-transfer RNA synthetases class-II family profile domain-containing protein n=1 Tax=Thyridium curvatum TaxID=1093900 RepID=A0A507ARH9_9PEZI|nr:uncharacterized protein E0L32_009488 [Thyridium curvatum]TPX09296.1 hypothetical protein E0L32_009488 [Thyridium curvatum]
MLTVHFTPSSSRDEFDLGRTVTVHGFLRKPKHMSSKLSFTEILMDSGPTFKVTSKWSEADSPAHQAHKAFKQIPAWSPVALTGTIVNKTEGVTEESYGGKFPDNVISWELELVSIEALNPFPKDIIISEGVQFPASSRHLQMRFGQDLRKRLQFRDHVKRSGQSFFEEHNFTEIETPVLFKSTPEGAREFIVPTRRPGLAYALPQSPQQYKQVLMSGGIGGYYQFARCFRDEDLRADRQPEFTQLDLEMSFATGRDVMRYVESLVKHIYKETSGKFVKKASPEGWYPVHRERQEWLRQQESTSKSTETLDGLENYPAIPETSFRHMSYQEAMSSYGSDKPDLRIPGKIHRIDSIVSRDFTSKISGLENPVVEVCKFRLDGDPRESFKFIDQLWKSLPTSVTDNPDGAPAILFYDSSKPMNGLFALGYDTVEELTNQDGKFAELGPFESGDILLIQARKDEPFQGGSTALGALRIMIYQEALAAGLLEADPNFHFLWVTGFPLFTPNNDVDPGQGGKAGFSATHHPFTAPLTAEDFELLATDPLRAKADHYDLVVNGIELGGGSRRIHVAKVQEFVMRDILQMTDEGVAQFSHLLEALRAGCPPHAGFALGFDRLVAVLSGTNSVRDVIAFPKSMKGEDLFAKSPGAITDKELETYHLALQK